MQNMRVVTHNFTKMIKILQNLVFWTKLVVVVYRIFSYCLYKM